MGFKLGKERGNYAVGGVIKNKMRFGKQAGEKGSMAMKYGKHKK